MSSVIIGKVAVRPMGEYDPAIEYQRLDIVRYKGSSYTVLKTCVGVTPEDDNEYYMLSVEKGDKGEQGERGLPGTGLKVIDYYDTLEDLKNNVQNPEVGDTYGVGISEPYIIYVYSKTDGWIDNGMIEGPEGPQGPKGDTGDSGVYVGDEEPTDPNVNVWIAPGGEASNVLSEQNMIDYLNNLFLEMATELNNYGEA